MQRKLKLIIVILVGLGIGLRLFYLLDNRSLWLDEAWLALGLGRLSFLEILTFQPLFEFLPKPPMGYLFFTKCFSLIFGMGEISLRMVSFLSSIVSMLLFAVIVVRNFTFHPTLKVLAVGLFCWSPLHVYYAVELKQYGFELMILTGWLYVFFEIQAKRIVIGLSMIILLGLAGVVSILSSYTSVFILAPMAVYLMFGLNNCRRTRVWILFALYSWLIAFMAVYFSNISSMLHHDMILAGAEGQKDFLFFERITLAALYEYFSKLILVFENLLTFRVGIFGFLMCCLGFFVYAARQRSWCFILTLPVVLMFAAFVLQKYPIAPRFVLFLMPVVILLFTQGLDWLVSYVPGKLHQVCLWLAVVGLLFMPVKNSLANLPAQYSVEEMRSVVEFFEEHYQEGDSIYLSMHAEYAFFYYYTLLDLKPTSLQVGLIQSAHSGPLTDQTQIFYRHVEFKDQRYVKAVRYIRPTIDGVPDDRPFDMRDVQPHPRVWFILSHLPETKHKEFVNYINRHGSILLNKESDGAYAYLLDLS